MSKFIEVTEFYESRKYLLNTSTIEDVYESVNGITVLELSTKEEPMKIEEPYQLMRSVLLEGN